MKGVSVIKNKFIFFLVALIFFITLIFTMHKNNISFKSSFNINLIGNDLDQYLKNKESQFSDLKKNVQKKNNMV